MTQRLIKYLTRKYALLEHYLVAQSLLKENSSIAEIFYGKVVDISKNGLMDIYIVKTDFEQNLNRIQAVVNKDRTYIMRMLNAGLVATDDLVDLPLGLPKEIEILPNKEIIDRMYKLRQKLFDFSGFFDLTHYLGKIDIKFKEEELIKLSRFHDHRKDVFMDYFKFLDKVCGAIAKKENVKCGKLSFLSFNEIICLLQGKLSPREADELQKKRQIQYILLMRSDRETIVSDDFGKLFAQLRKDFIEDRAVDEIKGMPINKGVAIGNVVVIDQKTSLAKIPSGKVIVTQMTSPSMTPILRKSKAIVTDEGGILCHAANVAREFGIISVIGTKIATKTLKDGDLVEVDANNGVIRHV